MLTLQGVQKSLDSSNFDMLVLESIQRIRPSSKRKYGPARVKEVQNGFRDQGQCSTIGPAQDQVSITICGDP